MLTKSLYIFAYCKLTEIKKRNEHVDGFFLCNKYSLYFIYYFNMYVNDQIIYSHTYCKLV
ncbi:uncharacterized protein DS421_4g119960 [Arachis hypogaea]|nr:uncharacterized protein DS421_4g119960 [Arachis hypogaea]